MTYILLRMNEHPIALQSCQGVTSPKYPFPRVKVERRSDQLPSLPSYPLLPPYLLPLIPPLPIAHFPPLCGRLRKYYHWRRGFVAKRMADREPRPQITRRRSSGLLVTARCLHCGHVNSPLISRGAGPCAPHKHGTNLSPAFVSGEV